MAVDVVVVFSMFILIIMYDGNVIPEEDSLSIFTIYLDLISHTVK